MWDVLGDRGMIKGPQIQLLKEFVEDNFHDISAVTKPQIEGLLKKGILQMSLFDSSTEEGGERFVVRRIRADDETKPARPELNNSKNMPILRSKAKVEVGTNDLKIHANLVGQSYLVIDRSGLTKGLLLRYSLRMGIYSG